MENTLDLKQKVFDLIYEEPDLEKGIHAALSYVGEAFRISRVYIFENNEANTHSSNTFEWCAEGIEPQIDELQHMSFEEYDYQSMFDASGLFFCPEVRNLPPMVRELLESQGIRATLQYAIYDKGVFRGFVGFDDCRGARPEWQSDGVSLLTLIYISRLLSVCLLKERNLQRAMELHRELEISLCKEKEMREAALRAVDAKTDFLSRMSHDMRTPMNGILGLTALSADETDAAVLRDNMLKIHASGEYLLGLINDILDSQKIETGRLQLNPQVVHGLSFMEDMLDMVRTIAQQKTIQLRMQIEREQLAGYIRVDPIRAKQICLNLLSNAIKFTPEHGSVTFALTAGDLPNGLRHVVIRVCDNGVGMSEDFLQNGLFHAFAQEYNALSPQNVSTGLGLSIVKRLVDLMGGSIAVESKLGVGSTFTVTLDVERVLPG
ncbi:MAG: ATP-binding protein, partial [Eubacteriales bacterium]|nr:ATP-binding protein [Eubacteriales bacterium]